MINIRDYGAVGDGTTDDTSSIQSAIAAATATGAAILYAPAGTYRTTAPLNVVSPHKVAVRGDGPQLTVFKPELSSGQYALTLGWDGQTETADHPGPYDALTGVGFLDTVGSGQPNCIRIVGQGTYPHASGLTLRNISIKGFDVQVELGIQAYLIEFDRVFFHSANTYGVKMDDVTNSGENIAFNDCCWSGGPGTGVYLNKSGASFTFSNCSFDYLKRAMWQRAGKVTMISCHFETDTSHGPGGEFIRLDRNGLVNTPMMTLTDCDCYDAWSNYDAFLRLAGEYGTNGLRIVNLYVIRAISTMPYLIRDDGTYPSSVVIMSTWYGRSDFPYPKMRKQDGTEFTISPSLTYQVGP